MKRTVLGLMLCAALTLRAEPGDEEKKALSAAEQSYRDGAFEVCNDRVNALLKKFPKTELQAPAELLQARALYQLGRDDAALAALSLPLEQVSEELRADTLFWQAETLLDLSKWPEAEQKYRALLALKNPGPHLDAGNLGLAWALFKQGRESEAQPLMQNLIKDKSKVAAGQQALLLSSKIELTHHQYQEAIDALQILLSEKPDARLAFEADYWLGETYGANGQFDLAVNAYRKVTDDPQAFPKPLVALANLGLGRSEHALHQYELAAPAYEKAYRLAESEPARLDAFHAYLESARAAKQLPEAIATLQEFAKTSDQSAPAALFAIGVVLAEEGSDDKAIGTLESLLVAYGKSPWIPAANDQLGRLYARTAKPDLAIKALQSCIDTGTDPGLVRTARYQLGSVLYQTRDYAGAAAQFAQVSDGTDSAAENAAFNFILAQAYLGKGDVFLKAEADFEKRFPKSTHLKTISLAEGRLLIGLKKNDEAKGVYQKALSLPGAGPEQKALLKALADLQYQTGDLEGTIRTCQATVDQFPDDSLEAAQRGILVSYELKKLTDDQVEQALTALAQKYGTSPGAAEAYFRLGEFYFYRSNYVKAQDAFQQLATLYPQSDYFDDAYFFAGRSAFEHQDYAGARALLEKVPDKSPLKSDARLWEGRSYQQQPNFFPQASALYGAVLATEKTGPRFVEANLRNGECLFEMGAADAAQYQKALDSFDAILKTNEGSIAERNEAAVRKAKTLEKMGRTDDAMALYLDVLYGRLAGDDPNTPAPPEFSWQIESGWQAARLRETQKDWRGAIEIYKRLEQIGGSHQQEFHDLVNKLRRDNYIYE